MTKPQLNGLPILSLLISFNSLSQLSITRKLSKISPRPARDWL
ncbi:MAG TPA: hypothetical protein VIY08_03005 [Candidatus Nitrosocosmicus sp.]